jgi:hypothetical protein
VKIVTKLKNELVSSYVGISFGCHPREDAVARLEIYSDLLLK